MIRRIIYIIVYILTIPILLVCCVISAGVTPILALLSYIVLGGSFQSYMNFIQAPFTWALALPHIIMGDNK